MKFELTESTTLSGIILWRIRALKDFGNVKKGDVGGFVQKESNLSHHGDCWIYDNAKVFHYAKVTDNASVSGNSSIFGSSLISENSKVDNSCVCGISRIYKNAVVSGNSSVKSNCHISYNLDSVKVDLISGNGYNINYSGYDPISKEHFIRVDCQTHSISDWKNEDLRNEIIIKTKFPKHLEKQCLQVLFEIEKNFVKENI